MRERGTAKRSTPVLNASGNYPLAYFITFTTHGTWLHGDARGSVDRKHADFDAERLRPDPGRASVMGKQLRQAPVVLNESARTTVDGAIRDACNHRGWRMEAVNVRTNHVHVVVGASEPPERVMTTFKAWATRRCREARLHDIHSGLWTRHGSTRYLWNDSDVAAAIDYVLNRQ